MRTQIQLPSSGRPIPANDGLAVRRPTREVRSPLAISEPLDRLEQEADRVADQVMGSPGAGAARGASVVAGSGPRPLEGEDRQFFESRFKHSFADVRIHAGPQAQASALGLHARAYTVGEDIAFAPGQYRPGTLEGRHLLAHELSHVTQQRARAGQAAQLLQRQPAEGSAKPAPAKQKNLKDAGVLVDDPVDQTKTAQLIDTVLQRNTRLAPYIGDKIKGGFKIAEKGKFVKEQRDADFDTSFQSTNKTKDTVPKSTVGFYDYDKSVVHLRPDARFATALHESVHRLASPTIYKSYLSQANAVSGDLMDIVKEGLTAYFTDLILNDEGLPNFNDANRTHKKKVEALVAKLKDSGADGFDLVAKLHFNGSGLTEIGTALGLSVKTLGKDAVQKIFGKIYDAIKS